MMVMENKNKFNIIFGSKGLKDKIFNTFIIDYVNPIAFQSQMCIIVIIVSKRRL